MNPTARRILLVEDDINSAKVAARILEKEGYITDHVIRGDDALTMISLVEYDLLIIDMVLPGMDGMEVLRNVKARYPDLSMIILTAYGSINSAVEALKAGAQDFLEKPVVPEKLLHVIRQTLETLRLRKEVVALRSDLARHYHFDSIIGKDPRMIEVFQLIQSTAEAGSAVLISGETGTGKDLVARAIHFNGPRKHRPFIAINCASVPETLLESELFGFERGAFTGAVGQKIGKLEQAQGGTVFLDEIGDMPMPLQGKLLRTLQEKRIERLGSRSHHPIDLNIRIISATNQNLPRLIETGAFRLDLYYRLNVVPIHLPPLRERAEDIPLLVEHFLERAACKGAGTPPPISGTAMSRLMAHGWPGNVRELENILERALILNRGETIEDIPFSPAMPPPETAGAPGAHLLFDPELPLKELHNQTLRKLDHLYLKTLLARYKGSIKRTAAHADVDARTIRRKMKAFGIDKWDFKETS